jgi:prolyl 4-hydroxylase
VTGESTRNPQWLTWLKDQVSFAADMGQAVQALRHAGIPDRAIAAAFEALRPRGSALIDGRLALPPLLARAPGNLRRLDAQHLDLYALDDFLSADECERISALAAQHLQPSPLSSAVADTAYRTSRTCVLAHIRSPIVAALDDRICRTLGIRAAYGEAIQAQRYDAGQQFKPHTDWFIPGSDDYARLAGLRGNRTWTFMVYLNEGMLGGGTRFTEIDFTVTPKAGMALFWNNLHPDGAPNPLMRHCGEPVTAGHKVIITKWFRVLGDGPVLHE